MLIKFFNQVGINGVPDEFRFIYLISANAIHDSPMLVPAQTNINYMWSCDHTYKYQGVIQFIGVLREFFLSGIYLISIIGQSLRTCLQSMLPIISQSYLPEFKGCRLSSVGKSVFN